jgi:phenylalanyl-tRNA synthetase alpha chain
MTPKEIEDLQARALEELSRLADLDEIEAWRIRYLGKNATLIHALRGLGELPSEQRRTLGATANRVKQSLEDALAERQETLKEAELLSSKERDKLDITLPGRPVRLGSLHPTTQILRQICGIFTSMGFQVVEGPEVEWDYYNFEALNIPEGHPARDMWATFWIDSQNEAGQPPMLLRTHTSPMQIRIMEKTQPPVRVVVPGKVYRYEATDATHESMFYQVEGLAVDKGVTMADLKGTLFEFARCLFGRERKARFRCDYFPFVEPGVEMAIDCLMCQGQGCRLCSNSGWLEILGAGMVHPDVLRRVGYDADVYSGFAFGMGVERMLMLRHGIEDIRLFYSNDLRFLKQF